MTGMTSRYLTVLDRELHYVEWGERGRDAIVMWHGLARTCRDFDDLAQHLADRYRVICPDTIGRGLSQWSPEPEQEYSLNFYAALATALVDALGIGRLRWIGTSMGGAIGMKVAGGALKDRISHLVLNDIGPEIADAAVTRIRSYAGSPPRFAKVSELEAYFRTIYKPFGYLSDAQWRRLAETSTRRTQDGKVTPHYDPNMVMQFKLHPEDYDQWHDYDRITAKTLCLRGEASDLLLPEIAAAMTRRGPRCRLEAIAGCGHAPALNVPAQYELIAGFLAE
jgi:pimeloyl-ACP methyl ester carboxylesterase